MSARIAARTSAPLLTTLSVVVALGLLTWRLRLATSADPGRSATLALTLGAVLVASLVLPAARGRPRPGRVVGVTLAGLTAFALAAMVAGPRPPVPWAGTAIGLSLLAAFAEEALFRRAIYGRLVRFGPVVAVAVTALGFALLHVPAYGWIAFPVDLGAGLVFGWQRHAAGTWAAPALTHAAVNLGVMLR